MTNTHNFFNTLEWDKCNQTTWYIEILLMKSDQGVKSALSPHIGQSQKRFLFPVQCNFLSRWLSSTKYLKRADTVCNQNISKTTQNFKFLLSESDRGPKTALKCQLGLSLWWFMFKYYTNLQISEKGGQSIGRKISEKYLENVPNFKCSYLRQYLSNCFENWTIDSRTPRATKFDFLCMEKFLHLCL